MQMLHNTPFNRSAQDRRSRFQMGCNGANPQHHVFRVDARYAGMTPICFRRVNSSELPQRSTILPSLNLEICIPRILTFLPVGGIFPRGPVCVPVRV